jgi:hypothetical protein
MGLGYEGWVQVGGEYALGTGLTIPRARPRLESSAGFGGEISLPVAEMGIGLPYNYDYQVLDGNMNFESDLDFIKNVVADWIFDRQNDKEVRFSPRNAASQIYDKCWWNSISLDASVDAALDGSISFVSLVRDTYTYGDFTMSKLGNLPGGVATPLCPDGDFPSPLNADGNLAPIPFWNTIVETIPSGGGAAVAREMTAWSLSFNQDVVKFFACEHNTSPTEPKYLAVGPMSVVFTGSYIQDTFWGDELDAIHVTIGSSAGAPYKIALKRCESDSEQDDLQSPDALTILDVEYTAYELEEL